MKDIKHNTVFDPTRTGHWTDNYTGETIEKPVKVKNVIKMLQSCNGDSEFTINADSEIVVNDLSGGVELHTPPTETFLVMKNGALDGQNYDYFNSPKPNVKVDGTSVDKLLILRAMRMNAEGFIDNVVNSVQGEEGLELSDSEKMKVGQYIYTEFDEIANSLIN